MGRDSPSGAAVNISEWMSLFWADESLYFFVGSVVTVLLVVLEMLLLRLREKAILGHLGWKDRDLEDGAGPVD